MTDLEIARQNVKVNKFMMWAGFVLVLVGAPLLSGNAALLFLMTAAFGELLLYKDMKKEQAFVKRME